MRDNKKILFGVLLTGTLISGNMISINASEKETKADNNIAYTLRVPAYHGNSVHTDGEYRQTTHTDNPWKVNQTSTSEGTGSSSNLTHYWLEKSNGTNVSHGYDVSSSMGAIYKNAYSGASETTVYLTAENNNFNDDNFTVKGYWDEETWSS